MVISVEITTERIVRTVVMFCFWYLLTPLKLYPRARRVEPDISISIHGSAPGSFPKFLKPENILDGVDKRVHGS